MNRFLLNYQSKIKRAAPLSSFSLFLFHPLFMFGNHCNLEQISTSNLNKCQFLIFEFFFFLKKQNNRWVSIYCKQLQWRSILDDNNHWWNPTVCHWHNVNGIQSFFMTENILNILFLAIRIKIIYTGIYRIWYKIYTVTYGWVLNLSLLFVAVVQEKENLKIYPPLKTGFLRTLSSSSTDGAPKIECLVKIEERRKNWMCFRSVCTPDEVPDDVSFKIV